MNENYKLWQNLTFKTIAYRKNFDLTVSDENFITEYEGTISQIRIGSRKPPFLAGEYTFSVWNIGLADQLDVDMNEVLGKYLYEDSYNELSSTINDGSFTFENIKKLVIIHNLILHPDYKKRGVTQEFVEFMFREHYNGEEDQIIALVKPIQENPVDHEHYFQDRIIKVKHSIDGDVPYEEMSAFKYFSLGNLYDKTDNEINEYKLYALASRCGFKRIGESHLFYFTPETTINRWKDKREEFTETLL